MKSIADWGPENDLIDVEPGAEIEVCTRAQRFSVIHGVIVGRDLTLLRLEVGPVEVPFDSIVTTGPQWMYRLDLADPALPLRLLRCGAAVAPRGTIAIVPGMEVRATVRNDLDHSVKLRVSIVVQEEEEVP